MNGLYVMVLINNQTTHTKILTIKLHTLKGFIILRLIPSRHLSWLNHLLKVLFNIWREETKNRLAQLYDLVLRDYAVPVQKEEFWYLLLLPSPQAILEHKKHLIVFLESNSISLGMLEIVGYIPIGRRRCRVLLFELHCCMIGLSGGDFPGNWTISLHLGYILVGTPRLSIVRLHQSQCLSQ